MVSFIFCLVQINIGGDKEEVDEMNYAMYDTLHFIINIHFNFSNTNNS